MGARQRAQKKAKADTKAAKNSLKGAPHSQKQVNSSILVPSLDPNARGNALLGWQNFASSSSPNHRNGLSMSEEARNTERHIFGWGNTKLRGNAVTFVSAGHLHQDELQDTPQSEETELKSPAKSVQEPLTEHAVSPAFFAPPPEGAESLTAGNTEPNQILPDIASNSNVKPRQPETSIASQKQRSTSVSSSDSEKIVFAGRSNLSQLHSKVPSGNVSEARTRQRETAEETKPLPLIEQLSLPAQYIAIEASEKSHTTRIDVLPHRRRSAVGGRKHRGRRRPQYISDEEEALMQDYIANMVVGDDDDESDAPEHLTAKPVRKNETLRFYNGGGEENVKVQVQSSVAIKSHKSTATFDLEQVMDWNSDDLEIFDNMSTSDEDVDDVAQILRHRERQSGSQYLVTANGKTIEDAKWILQSRLVSASALEEIRIYEEIQAMRVEENSFSDEDDTSGSEDEEALDDLIEQIESEDDENARILAHTARMTDEQIARRLAKQEELGFDADAIMLFGDDLDVQGESHRDRDAFSDGDDFIAFSTKKHTSNRTRAKHNKKQRDTFPPAAAFADALDEDPYGGFDIMDFDRPSLRPRKKGRKSDFPYDVELEDDDLRDQLVSTWVKDREKKATRKKEKEEARMVVAFDVSERSEPAVIKAEIRRFLCQDIDALKLAPMDSSTRASVHRLAKALGLHSRSEGSEAKGNGRYPVLTKTARTPMYTISTIWEVDALMNTRKFFPKSKTAYKTPKPTRAIGFGSRRSGGVQGASYMNGEIVGASAPELGADNKGRAMLEKMGWTTGMGIGAEGNKGSLEAIKHVVKTTKAGLG